MSEQANIIIRVQALIEALENTEVGELELTDGGTTIQIKRTSAIVPTVLAAPAGSMPAYPMPMLPGTPALPTAVPAPAAGRAANKQRPAEEQGVAVVSPLMGVYYSSPSPDSDAFVKVGDAVQAGQVVAIVEAMKVFNEVKSEIAGIVVALPAQNGQLVQKGDPLVRIQPI
ncbi:MAG TPA: acetyl-CoA carboxylase biotin carboxyl carrier protein [Ktedonobacterales bacterium]|jgi:acetyl-CoA carboxylase biotin carboxyl carrier protein